MPSDAPQAKEIGLAHAGTFVSAMQLALANGDTALLEKAMPLLQDLIDRIQREVYSLSELQLRACVVRDEYLARFAERPDVLSTGSR